MEVKQYSEDSLTVNLGSEIDEKINKQLVQLKSAVTELNLEGITDIVLSYTSLIIYFDVLKADSKKITGAVKALELRELKDREYAYKVVKIPVCYGGEFGPDLARFKEDGLTPEDVISIHSNKEYLVYMLGFMPGFPFLGGLSDKLFKARLDSPRTKIQAGTVGIGGRQTGIYPFDSPGGWNLLGRTPVPLYDSSRDNAILYEAGDRIIFTSIDEREYYRIKEAYDKGEYTVETEYRGEADGA